MGCLRLENVTYRKSLRDVTLTVDAGEAVEVLVAHRVERLALMDVSAGIKRPDSGTVHVDGRLVFARLAWPAMGGTTVIGQLSLPLLASSHTVNSAHAAALGLLTEWDREDWSARDLSDLEEHELVLLSLFRALAAKPDVLLINDPTAGYGNQLVDDVCALLRAARTKGAAVLIAASRTQQMTATTSLYGLSEGLLRGSRFETADMVSFPRVPA